MNNKTRFIAEAAVIAALYTVLTVCLAPVSSGVIQVRISEAMTILPCFTPAAIPGLFLGCLISGFLTGLPLDAIVGSLATLAAAILTYFLSKVIKSRRLVWLCALPPVICNAIAIPFVLKYVYLYEGALWYFVLTVGAGEIISAGILGMLLYKALTPFFKK